MTPNSTIPEIDLFIGDDERNWGQSINKFKWQSFLNMGFILWAGVDDHGFDMLDTVFSDDKLAVFRSARQNQKPTTIKFRLKWTNGYATPWRTALISDMHARGKGEFGGRFEFIALDPVSFHLNNGDSSGRVWKGKVGGQTGVIMQVLNNYLPSTIAGKSIVKSVSDTIDTPTNHWMMRQDPKTFISSILDWSSSLTQHKTSWIVANGETEDNIAINIEESYTPNLRDPSPIDDQKGPLLFTYGGTPLVGTGDITSWEMLHDSFLVALNSRLTTSGLSAVSGEYLDRVVDTSKNKVFVDDDNTQYKVNPSFGPDRGYSKPSGDLKRGWTHITSVPEPSAGDLGVKYNQYIDGRARQFYMEMLNMVMRIRVTVPGEPRLFDCTDLGRSKITLRWNGIEEPDRAKFMDGNWLLYGWCHRVNKTWETDVYLARLDYDAKSLPGSKQV